MLRAEVALIVSMLHDVFASVLSLPFPWGREK